MTTLQSVLTGCMARHCFVLLAVCTIGFHFAFPVTAVPLAGGRIQAHIFAHTHDDPGWLKTVDEYYYGARNDIYRAGVQYILDSVIDALIDNPKRRFIWVESSFFWRWWGEQAEARKDVVRRLVSEGRLEFINGGWVMHDEAGTYYSTMIDQTTLGHEFLKKEFGVVPRVAWHIDPFGHSSASAYMYSQMNMDGFFFARIDYQDREVRKNTSQLDLIWRGDVLQGEESDIFTSVLYKHYSAPDGFCFDTLCNNGGDEPVQADKRLSNTNIHSRAQELVAILKKYQMAYPSRVHVPVPFGDDFNYQNANKNFKNMDLLFQYINEHPEFGVDVVYSTPSMYVDAVKAEKPKLRIKTDDFFPYRDNPFASWTGYFTSRPVFKGLSRLSNAVLQTYERMLSVFGNAQAAKHGLMKLRRAEGLAQHHDAITGTGRTAVADDYVDRIFHGLGETGRHIQSGVSFVSGVSQSFNLNDSNHSTLVSLSEQPVPKNASEILGIDMPVADNAVHLTSKLVLDLSQATASEDRFMVTIVNPLGWKRDGELVSLNVSSPVWRVTDSTGADIKCQYIPLQPEGKLSERYRLVFRANVPALGFSNYVLVKMIPEDGIHSSVHIAAWAPMYDQNVAISNEAFKAEFFMGNLVSISNAAERTNLAVEHEILWYSSSPGNQESGQTSGAYIFRPDGPARKLAGHWQSHFIRGPLFSAVHRAYQGQEVDELEVTYVLESGDLPITMLIHVNGIHVSDVTGREFISRFNTEIVTNGKFFTDSNGLNTMERILNHRDTWTLNITDKFSDNYYPVTARASIRCEKGFKSLGIATDRAHGSASLQEGQLETMIHRRITVDDGRGVAEPLNETGWLANLRLRQRIHVGTVSSVENALRFDQLHVNYPMIPIILPSHLLTEVSEALSARRVPESFSGVLQEFPHCVELVSLNTVLETGQILLRLRHIGAKGLDGCFGQPASVNIMRNFRTFEVITAKPVSLNGVASKRPNPTAQEWNYEAASDIGGQQEASGLDRNGVVTLQPGQLQAVLLDVKYSFGA